MTQPTEAAEERIYRTRTGRVLTDADIERIAEEVATTDFDFARAVVLYPPDGSEPARNSDMRLPRAP